MSCVSFSQVVTLCQLLLKHSYFLMTVLNGKSGKIASYDVNGKSFIRTIPSFMA